VFIYKITNIKNGKAYIGLTTKSVCSRWKAHISNAFVKNVQYYLYKAMRKNGLDSFKVETLYEAVDLRELVAVEKGLIAQYGTLYSSNGYNQSSGGESRSGIKLSPEIVDQMRVRTMAQLAANGHPMQGKKHSDKSRAKMSVSAKCKPPISDETRRKFSIAATGRVIPREAVERARQKRLGVKRTLEQCARIAAGRRAVTQKKNRGNRKYPVELITNAIKRVRAGEKQGYVAMSIGIQQSYMSQLMSGKRGNSLQ
jgi:group I intron endonuclease